jgi:UDP-N-acetyl-D-glucosamine dehydrogenase
VVRLPDFLSLGPNEKDLPKGQLLERRIRTKRAVVGVVGQGYVGYPLAQRIAQCGFQAIGFDINASTLERCVASNGSHRYRATGNVDHLQECDVIVVAVPTPTVEDEGRRSPDLSLVVTAIDDVAPVLAASRRERLVVLESTYAPGTTREVVAPRLVGAGHLGHDVFLGYSPERIDPGNEEFDLANTPKVTSGFDERSAELTQLFYSRVVARAVPASSMEAAEATKLLENTFRFINITFAQEFDEYCEQLGLNAREVTMLAGTKPFGFMPFYAGAGIGGHCIAEDPYYLEEAIRRLGQQAEILQAALKNHEARSGVITRRIQERLGRARLEGLRLLLLGVSYKANVGDARQSPAAPLLEQLERLGAIVDFHDPYVTQFAGRTSQRLENLSPNAYDLVVAITHHADFSLQALEDAGWAIFDTTETPAVTSQSPQLEHAGSQARTPTSV